MVGSGKLYLDDPDEAEPFTDINGRSKDGIEFRKGVARGAKVVRNYGDTTAAVILDGTRTKQTASVGLSRGCFSNHVAVLQGTATA